MAVTAYAPMNNSNINSENEYTTKYSSRITSAGNQIISATTTAISACNNNLPIINNNLPIINNNNNNKRKYQNAYPPPV